MTEPLATMRDVREAKFCARGARALAARYGWSDFLRAGIPIRLLEESGDELALRVAAIARARLAGGDA